MTRSLLITLVLLTLLLTGQERGLVFWTERLAYAEPAEDYVVSTSTTISDGKAIIKISLWTSKSHLPVSGTTVIASPEDLDEDTLRKMFGASGEEKAIRAGAIEGAKWVRQQFPLPRVKITASSANIMKDPSLQSARITTVPRGTVLRKVREQRQWVEVIVDDNNSGSEIGWVYSELVELVK